MENQSGAKVGVVWGAINGPDGQPVLYVLGEGTYVGDVIPSLESGLDCRPEIGILTPKIVLQDGSAVYGCECFWGDLESTNRLIAVNQTMGNRVETIPLAQAIEISKKAADGGPIPVRSTSPIREYCTTVIVTAGTPLSVESAFMGTLFTVAHLSGHVEGEIVTAVKDAVSKFLQTPEGEQASEEASGSFCWWDLPPYLDDIRGYLPDWIVAIRHIEPEQLAFAEQNTPLA